MCETWYLKEAASENCVERKVCSQAARGNRLPCGGKSRWTLHFHRLGGDARWILQPVQVTGAAVQLTRQRDKRGCPAELKKQTARGMR